MRVAAHPRAVSDAAAPEDVGVGAAVRCVFYIEDQYGAATRKTADAEVAPADAASSLARLQNATAVLLREALAAFDSEAALQLAL